MSSDFWALIQTLFKGASQERRPVQDQIADALCFQTGGSDPARRSSGASFKPSNEIETEKTFVGLTV
jgi:hypothetical protein